MSPSVRPTPQPWAMSLICLVLLSAMLAAQLPFESSVAGSSTPSEDTPPAQAVSRPASPASQERSTGADWAREQMISGLIGSKHDFTEAGKRGRDLCLPCHTPHLVSTLPPRLDRRVATTQPLRPYAGVGVELSGWSLLCLGCHDGVTAPDVYSSEHALASSGQIANSRMGSTRLRSHPVGIRYPPATERYHQAAAVETAGLLLPDGCIQCTTCHDAHNTHRHRGMLRITNERSRLCLTCHRI